MNHFEDYTVIDGKFDYAASEQYCWNKGCGGSLDDDSYVEVVENGTQIYYYHVGCYVPPPGLSAPTNARSAAAYETPQLLSHLVARAQRIKALFDDLSGEVAHMKRLQAALENKGIKEEADVPQDVLDELLAAQEAYDAFEREYVRL